MAELVGRQIEQYRILSLHADGGMGSVYRAQDVNLQREVAIKVTHAHLARQSEFQRRFLQEAQAAAQLDHPSIVKILEFGQRDELLFMVMEFLPDGSLGGYIRQLHAEQKLVELREILFLLAQVADALGFAHTRGVIHRDVKPDNVLLKRLERPERAGEPPLRAVVTDFGLAKLLEGGVRTRTNSLLGTLGYISPEQALGHEIDGRSDLYSLGVILYQLSTGQLPFEINTPADALQTLQWSLPPSPVRINPGLPPGLVAVILKALAKKPPDRYQTGEEMAGAMREARAQLEAGDVARFDSVFPAVSLATRLQRASEEPPELPTMMTPEEAPEAMPQPAPVRPPAPAPSPPASQKSEEKRAIYLTRQGMAPERIALEKTSLTIGRGSECDLVLNEAGVSRRHVRLEQIASGWQATDLGSSNGTYLDDSKLPANTPQPWQPGQTLHVSFFELTLQKPPAGPVAGAVAAVGAAASSATGAMMDMPLPSRAKRMQTISGQLGVVVNPSRLTMPTGKEASVQVSMLNQGAQVAHYSLRLQGIPNFWFTLPPAQAQLMPGETMTLPLTFHPPRASDARAGDYSVQLLLTSQDGDSLPVPITLTVEPFHDFQTDLQPRYVNHGDEIRVTVLNKGNVQSSYFISVQDPGEEVTFEAAQPELVVEPGEEQEALLEIAAKDRPTIGKKRLLPFEAIVSPEEGASQTQAGQLSVSPRFPGWMLPLLAVLLLLCCGVTAISAQQIYSFQVGQLQMEETSVAGATATDEANATATSQANETAVAEVATATTMAQFAAETATSVASAEFETATAEAVAAAETASAATSTAVAADDPDEDGLSTTQEEELKTDPNNPDTDNDGLSDGDEVIVWQTNPLNPDMDLDRLLDGTEIAMHTQPDDRDTDDDGTPDDIDPFPLQRPTPTPTPTLTPTPTETPEVTPTGGPPPPGGTGNGLDFSLPTNSGAASLDHNYPSFPLRIAMRGGGEVDVNQLGLGSSCVGYATAAPDFRLKWTSTSGETLVFLFQADDVAQDATLIINDPNDNWVCNDDSNNATLGPRDPGLPFVLPASGQYDIWVGSYEPGIIILGTLIITVQ